jgi:parallel beta-helix repeat protein
MGSRDGADIPSPFSTVKRPLPLQTSEAATPPAALPGGGHRPAVDSPMTPPRRLTPPDVRRQQTVVPPTVDRFHRNDTLTQDTHWQGNVLVEGALFVPSRVTLTVAPGTTVRFRSGTAGSVTVPGTLLVEGRLVISGTAEEPVALLPAATPSLPGDWQGIVLQGSEKRNIIEQCRIEGAATAVDLLFSAITIGNVTVAACDTGLRLQDSLALVRGSSLSDSLIGCQLSASELEMKETRLTANRTGILATSSSLLLDGCSLAGNERAAAVADCRVIIQACSVSGNGTGIYLQGGEGSLSGNRLSQNSGDGLHLVGARVRVTGNDIARNGRSGLVAEDGLAAVWGNAFRGNTLYDLEHRGEGDLRAMGNWWQPRDAGSPSSGGGAVALGTGTVLTLPPLANRPPLNGQP